jgi:uncharacterized membrane protein
LENRIAYEKNGKNNKNEKNEKIEKSPVTSEKLNLSYSRHTQSTSHTRFLTQKQAIITHINNVVDDFNHKKIKMLNTAYLNLNVISE